MSEEKVKKALKKAEMSFRKVLEREGIKPKGLKMTVEGCGEIISPASSSSERSKDKLPQVSFSSMNSKQL